MSDSYLDCDITIDKLGDAGYPVRLRSPAGEAHAMMAVPFDRLKLENYLLALQNALLRSGGRQRKAHTPETQAVMQFGRATFQALFSADIRSRYDLSLERAEHEGKGLRLRLRIAAPELAALPWEYLYDHRADEYIVLSNRTSVVRHLEVPLPIQPFPIVAPLRILALVANPSDQQQLDVNNERQRLDQATADLVKRGLVELHWANGQTWRDLQRTLRQGPWHILHFIGHGSYSAAYDEGIIVLADEHDQSHRLRASELARLLADHRSLRLVVLNSCDGARGSEADLFASTAATLARRCTVAVLAMQYEISDDAAIEFSRSFYEALAEMLPVDTAVAEARKAMSLTSYHSVEWGTPVLYMRSADGRLFDAAALLAKPTPEPVAAPPVPVATPVPVPTKPQAVVSDEQLLLQSLIPRFEKAYDVEEWDEAIRRGEQILSIDERQADITTKVAWVYRNRGVSYDNKGDYDRAIADFDRAIALDPTNANFYYKRGLSFSWKDEEDRAIADCDHAIALDPTVADFYDLRGLSYAAKGDRDRAIAEHNQAITIDSQSGKHYYIRGLTHKAMNNFAAARRDFQRAVKLGYTEAEAQLKQLPGWRSFFS